MSEKIAEAMEVLKQAMIDDGPGEPGSYAHSWHCNIAMMCYDAMMGYGDIGLDDFTNGAHKVSNDAASRFMKLCFDVETNNGEEK